MNKHFDVAILGGGLAGLTLALQTKKMNPDASIIVMESRDGAAPDAAHKVGESTVELGTHYIREVLDLKDYMDEHQLPKHGLRFFFSPQHKGDIARRVELGPRKLLPVPSHQIDRGSFENKLAELCLERGIKFEHGAKVSDVQLNGDKHIVTYTQKDEQEVVTSRWVVDATGRASFLKRKLGLKKEIDHAVCAAWFRIKGDLNVDEWSDNKEWNTFLEPGLRRLGTIHFMDKGYWVWLIPLATGNTSVGIVADPAVHPFDTYNKLDKALNWLEINEPLCFKHINPRKEDILDFRVMKHFAQNSEKLYSHERWAISGESGVFLDPFYSPGTDFISLNNTFISDLITKDLAGTDISLQTEFYEKTLLALFNNWVPVYENRYPMWGSTQTMIFKIFWDWAVYWAVPTLLFTNEGFTNLMVLKNLFASEDGAGQRFGKLNNSVQSLFSEWVEYDTNPFEDRYIDPFDLHYLKDLHLGLEERFSTRELVAKVNENVGLLEEIASEMFRLMSNKIHGTSMDMKVDPFNMSLKTKPQENSEGIVARAEVKKDVAVMWFYQNQAVL
jgi:flavin-dependent dehydrogenase|tara:strand:+ start:19215 stop:20888 length:1674 start_codon:yes stop_codon:yes gene_type:complete